MRNYLLPVISFVTLFLLSSCDFFNQKKENLKRTPIVKVYDKYLYADELMDVTSNSSKEDSAKMAAVYIQDWITRQLLIQNAKKNLSSELLDIDKKVEDYKESLIIFNYESELIRQKLDTSISIDDRMDYYNKHKENFILDEGIHRMVYIKVLRVTPNIEMWLSLMKSEKQEDKVLLKSLAKSEAIKYNLNEGVWKSKDQICSDLQISDALFSKAKTSNKIIRIDEGEMTYLFNQFESKEAGEQAPFDFVNDKIYLLLLNKKKSAFLEGISKEIYNDAIKENAIQQFSMDGKTN